MMNITRGKLITKESNVIAGEYWTSEATADYYTVCISWNGKLLSMDKSWFSDWLQLHQLLIQDEMPTLPNGPAFDPFDIGMDVE